MTVLPQLERELRSAHCRSGARRWPLAPLIGWGPPASAAAGRLTRAAAIVVSIAVVAAVVAVVGTSHHRPRTTTSALSSAGTTAGAGAPSLQRLIYPAIYATPRALYAAGSVRNDTAWWLLRLGPDGSRVTRAWSERFGAVDDVLLAHGWLWVTTTYKGTTTLLRMDPVSLAWTRIDLPGQPPAHLQPPGTPGSLAIAGGGLWVGVADEMVRVSLGSGQVLGAVRVQGSAIEVAAGSGGHVLLTGTGGEISRLQRRDPVTGRVLATSPVFRGVTTPAIGGIIDGRVWISQPGGMAGYVEQLDLQTLRPTSRPIEGRNSIRARVVGGVLWVSDAGGGVGPGAPNFCADAMSADVGRVRSILHLPLSGELLAVEGRSLIYTPDAQTGSFSIAQMRAPAACFDPAARVPAR